MVPTLVEQVLDQVNPFQRLPLAVVSTQHTVVAQAYKHPGASRCGRVREQREPFVPVGGHPLRLRSHGSISG